MAEGDASIAVILSSGGAALDMRAMCDLPRAKLIRAEFAWGERVACATATLEHECDRTELLAALKGWAAGRGWLVTVAPLPRPD